MAATGAPAYLISLAQRNTELAEKNAALLTKLAEIELARQLAVRPRLTSREQRIVNVIGKGRMLGKNIAKALGLKYVNGFQASLAKMKDAGKLNHTEGGGYAVEEEWHDAIQFDDDEDGSAQE